MSLGQTKAPVGKYRITVFRRIFLWQVNFYANALAYFGNQHVSLPGS